MDGVARSRKVTSAREAKGKQWSGREAVKVWKRSVNERGSEQTACGEFGAQSLRGKVEVEA